MIKNKGIVAMFAAIVMASCMSIAACSPSDTTPAPHQDLPHIVSKSNNDNVTAIQHNETPTEVCYKGIKYVYFNNGNASWGSVEFQNNGAANPTVATCD